MLRQLVIDTRETANVGTVSGGQIVYLDRVEAIWPLTFRLDVGSRVPIYCSAIGKMLLSRMSDSVRLKYLDALPLRPRTEKTICDRGDLLRELDRIRELGVAVDDEECFTGVIGIAVAVGVDRLLPAMGLALVAPSSRQNFEKLMEFVPDMQEAAENLAKCYST